MASRDLPAWFAKRGPVLTTAELAVLVMTAEQPSTWSANLPPERVDFERFRELADEVEAASDRRQTVFMCAAALTIVIWLGVAAGVLAVAHPELFAH